MAQQPQGTGFTNLSQFLQANQGSNLGQAVASNVQGQASSIGNQLGQLYGNFQQQASANALGTPEQQQASQAALNQIIGGNTTVDPNQANQFQQYLAGQYQGPTQLDQGQTSQLSTQASNLSNMLSGPTGINTTAGRQNVLRNVITNPQYTQGEQVLDATLLGQNQGALSQAKQSAAGLGQAIQQKQAAAQATGQQNTAQAQGFAQQVGQELQGASTGLDTAVQNQLAQQQATQALGAGQVFNNLTNNPTVNAQTAQLLGMTPDQLANLNVVGISNLAPYVSANTLNTGTAITPQQIAQYNALAQLSGKPITDITQIPTAATSTAQPGQLFSLDTSGLQTQTTANKTQLQSQNTQLQQTLQNMQAVPTTGSIRSSFMQNNPAQYANTLNQLAQNTAALNQSLNPASEAQTQQQLQSQIATNNYIFAPTNPAGPTGPQTVATQVLQVSPDGQAYNSQFVNGNTQQKIGYLNNLLSYWNSQPQPTSANPGLAAQIQNNIQTLQKITNTLTGLSQPGSGVSISPTSAPTGGPAGGIGI